MTHRDWDKLARRSRMAHEPTEHSITCVASTSSTCRRCHQRITKGTILVLVDGGKGVDAYWAHGRCPTIRQRRFPRWSR